MLVPPVTGPSHGVAENSSVSEALPMKEDAPVLPTSCTLTVEPPARVASRWVTSSASAQVSHVSSPPKQFGPCWLPSTKTRAYSFGP